MRIEHGVQVLQQHTQVLSALHYARLVAQGACTDEYFCTTLATAGTQGPIDLQNAVTNFSGGA
jgi:hypothetical protein